MPLFAGSDAVHLSAEQLHGFLQLICSGHAQAYSCEVCPNGTSLQNGRWDVAAVFFGHFLSPESQDALLSGIGCEAHASGSGGSFLLTRSAGTWRIVNYAAGRIAKDCEKVKGSDKREVLICAGSDSHTGIANQFLYLLDPRASDLSARGLDIFFSVSDSLSSCTSMLQDSQRVVEGGKIDQVNFAYTAGADGVTIIVDAELGQAILSEATLESCNLHLKPGEEWLRPRLRTVRERFLFFFDGKIVTPSPGNPPTKPPQAQAILPQTFTSPDSSFSITIPASFRIFTGKDLKQAEQLSYIPVCEDTDLACFVYPTNAYRGTNFSAASIEVSNIHKPDEASCMAPPKARGNDDQFLTPKYMPVRSISGSRWIHGVFTGAAAGHIGMEDIYRTWHQDKCWEIKTNLTETDVNPHPTFTRKDEQQVEQQLDAVLNEFRFLPHR
jgi:hypothetical protein